MSVETYPDVSFKDIVYPKFALALSQDVFKASLKWKVEQGSALDTLAKFSKAKMVALRSMLENLVKYPARDATLQSLKKEQQVIEQSVAELDKKFEEFMIRMRELEEENAALRQAENSNPKSKASGSSRKLTDLERKFEKVSNEKKTLESDLVVLKEEKKSRDQKMIELQNELTAMHNQLGIATDLEKENTSNGSHENDEKEIKTPTKKQPSPRSLLQKLKGTGKKKSKTGITAQ